jgi:Glycosyl hydrolase catalytic core
MAEPDTDNASVRKRFVRWSALALLTTLAVSGYAGLRARGATRPNAVARASAVNQKRGVASSRYLASNPVALSRLGASWAYDWTAKAPARGGGPQWVPMVWGSGSVTPAVLASLRAARRSGRVRELLGFNEPDSASQSNMSPARAVALWPQLERTGLRLGSPAPALPSDGWLARFMALARARRLRVDFIALHFYQDFTNPSAVSELRRQLASIYHEYRKPIWVTEIGTIDIRRWKEPMMRTPTYALAARYMHQVFAVLDTLPFVERYAWFTDSCWNDTACRFSSLFTTAGRLTLAGVTFETAR